MANLDWSQCRAVESVPGRRSGAWVFKDTRMPAKAVLEFAARSLDAPAVPVGASAATDAHSL